MPGVNSFTPLNQRRHDNISVVSIEKTGKRFEIACYRNKVMDWKTGAEKDITKVLQLDRVFFNVRKGEYARNEALQKAFGTTDQEKITLEILNSGTTQVNSMERDFHRDKSLKQIAHTAAEMSMDPYYHRLYTGRIIEQAMTQFGYSIKPNTAIKAQALEVIRFLKAQGMPIERTCMKFVVQLPTKESLDQIKRWIKCHSLLLTTRIHLAWVLRHTRLTVELSHIICNWVPLDPPTYELHSVLSESQLTTNGSTVFTFAFLFPPALYNRVERLVKDVGGTVITLDVRYAQRDEISISELVVPDVIKNKKPVSEPSSEDDSKKSKNKKDPKSKKKDTKKRGEAKEDIVPSKAKSSELNENYLETIIKESDEPSGKKKKEKKKPQPNTTSNTQPTIPKEKKKKKKNEDDPPTPSDEEDREISLSRAEREKLRKAKLKKEKEEHQSSDSELFYSDKEDDYEEYLGFYEDNNDYRRVKNKEKTEDGQNETNVEEAQPTEEASN